MLSTFDKLKESLTRTKDSILGRIADAVNRRRIDDDLLEEIEQILIEADVGVKATGRLIERIKETCSRRNLAEGGEIIALLKEEIAAILSREDSRLFHDDSTKLLIWLITGVNGVGKTTTIGKLATRFSGEGKKVIIGACDTFRAAAIDQIAIWAERSGVEIVRSQEGADPAAVAFDATTAARTRNADILLIDTAGRLHTKSNLMEELKKIRRVVQKAAPDARICNKLIIDGTTGQNALAQATIFMEAIGCDGLIITKLDGTARGGAVIAVTEELGVPVDFIGLGEGIDDLQRFDAREFAEALLA